MCDHTWTTYVLLLLSRYEQAQFYAILAVFQLWNILDNLYIEFFFITSCVAHVKLSFELESTKTYAKLDAVGEKTRYAIFETRIHI